MADYAIHEETLVDVSNVIRKKDGTSALIDPADYAERINLMGMLEEKTVSGAIATFDDGADEVPLKKCSISLPASLDGYSEIDVVSAGKNLVDYGERAEMVRNNITSSISADGTITASGTSTGNGDMPITLDTSMFLKGGQPYTISFTGTDTRSGSVYIYFAGGSYISINNANHSGTYTPSADQTITGITLRMFNGQSITMSAKMMIEAGNVLDISYEPYTAPTTHTAQLGRTIYYSIVDVIAGQGQEAGGKYNLGDLTWNADANRSGVFYTSTISGVKTDNCALECDSYTVDNSKNPNTIASGEMCSRSSYGGQRVFIKDDNFAGYTGEQVKTALSGEYAILELATSIDFTFDPVPIDSKLGNNTILSEQGSNSEVTYRGQGTAYIYPSGEGVSF